MFLFFLSPSPLFDDRELYKGVLFGIGDVAGSHGYECKKNELSVVQATVSFAILRWNDTRAANNALDLSHDSAVRA